MGGEDLGGASVKKNKKTIHVNWDIAYTSKGYGLIMSAASQVLRAALFTVVQGNGYIPGKKSPPHRYPPPPPRIMVPKCWQVWPLP